MSKDEDDIKTIREEIVNKFILPAKSHGQKRVAKALEEILPLLTPEMATRKTADMVTELSKKAKEEALVNPENSLDIITILPDWYKYEKSLLKEKAEKGLVQVGIRRYEQIPERIMKDMDAIGIKVRPATGVTSLNLSSGSVTLYYTSDPWGSPSLPERAAIRITGDAGRILEGRLNSIRTEWFSDESALGRQKEELIAARILELIQKDSSDLRSLKEILRNEEIPGDRAWRIALMVHCLQIREDRFYSIDEIAKELECRPEMVRGCIYFWYKHRNIHPFDLYEFDLTEKGREKVKLLPATKDHIIPWTFYQVLVFAVAAGDKEAKKLMEKYNLPPFRKKGLLRRPR